MMPYANQPEGGNVTPSIPVSATIIKPSSEAIGTPMTPTAASGYLPPAVHTAPVIAPTPDNGAEALYSTPSGATPPPPPVGEALPKKKRAPRVALGFMPKVVRKVVSKHEAAVSPIQEKEKPSAQAPRPREEHKQSILNRTAHFFIAPLAILDIITVVLRIVIAGSAVAAPGLYDAYAKDWWGVALNLGLLAALSLSVADGLQLWIDRYGQLRSRFNTAARIQKAAKRREREAQITLQCKRAMNNIYILASIVLASIVLLIFSQIATGAIATFMKYFVALVDAVAPMVALALISFADYESMDEDPGAMTMSKAMDAIGGALTTIGRHALDGELNNRDVNMLKKGINADVPGMLDSATTYDHTLDWMSVTDICKMYGWSYAFDSSARQRVTYALRKAAEKGIADVRKGDNGVGLYTLRETIGLVITDPHAITVLSELADKRRADKKAAKEAAKAALEVAKEPISA